MLVCIGIRVDEPSNKVFIQSVGLLQTAIEVYESCYVQEVHLEKS